MNLARFWDLTLLLQAARDHSSVFGMLRGPSVGDRVTGHVVIEALDISNSFCKMLIIVCAELLVF
jgi:hypothetical protein